MPARSASKPHEQFYLRQARLRDPNLDIIKLGEVFALQGEPVPEQWRPYADVRVVARLDGRDSNIVFPLTNSRTGHHHGNIIDPPRDFGPEDCEWLYRNNLWRIHGRWQSPADPSWKRYRKAQLRLAVEQQEQRLKAGKDSAQIR